MNALQRLFNPNVNQYSPVVPEKQRVVHHDEDGNEYITFEPVDLAKLQKSLGTVSDWSLDSLVKAGINPNFSISTGVGTRLEGLDALSAFEAEADRILAETQPKE